MAVAERTPGGDPRFSRRKLFIGAGVGAVGIAGAFFGVPPLLGRVGTVMEEWAEVERQREENLVAMRRQKEKELAEVERQRVLAFERESTLGFTPSHPSLTGWTVRYLSPKERGEITLFEGSTWRRYQVYPRGSRPVFEDNFFDDRDGVRRDTRIELGIYTRQDGVSVPSLTVVGEGRRRVGYLLRSQRGNDREDVVLLENPAMNNGKGATHLASISARPETSELVVRWFGGYARNPK